MTSVVAAFVIIAAVAIILQMAILFVLYKSMKQTAGKMEAIAGRMEQQTTPLIATAQAILEDAQPKIAEITSNLAESSATMRAHVSQVAEATGEIVERARLHAARVDEFVVSTMGKIETATDILESKVLNPVRRVQGIMAAVNAGLGLLRASKDRGRARGAAAGQDDEMFI